MTAMMRVPRTRGVGSGLLLILLGAWGALIPFVGPYFHFAYTPDTAWTWTWGRFFLEVVPGVAAALGGLILMISAFRPVAMFGAVLAAAARRLVHRGAACSGRCGPAAPRWACPAVSRPHLTRATPTGGPLHMVAEHLSFFTALGVVIVFLAAVALRPPGGRRHAGRRACGRRGDLGQARPVREGGEAREAGEACEAGRARHGAGRRPAERVAPPHRGAVTSRWHGTRAGPGLPGPALVVMRGVSSAACSCTGSR